MIANFLANNPYFWAVMATLWQTTELYLGLKKPMDAGSVPQLLWRMLCTIQLRFTKTKPKEGAIPMPTNPNAISVSVSVDAATWNLGATILDAADKVLAGEKPPQILAEEIGPVMAQMGALAQIPADFAGDRATVLNAGVLRAVQLEEKIRLHPSLTVVPALVSK